MDQPSTPDAHGNVSSGTDLADQVVHISEPVRRYVQAHTRQPADTEDVVQETLTRVLEHGRGLAVDSALAYALVTARHVLADRAGESERQRRHAHRLLDLTRPDLPEDELLDEEDGRALRQALAGIPGSQQRLLLAHVLEAVPVTELAAEEGKSDAALAAQLARVRARLRLDYVLALRGISLPTSRCRPILLALSVGDVRRQEVLRAGHHLLACSVCADLAEPLLRRRRALAAVLPWIGAGPLIGLLRRLWMRRPVQMATAATTAAVAVAGGAALIWGPTASSDTRSIGVQSRSPAVSASPSSTPTVSAGRPGSPSAGPAGELIRTDNGHGVRAESGNLRSLAGQRVMGRSMRVLGVPADEGFWVANTGGDRVWIQLGTGGHESSVNVKSGESVSFTGVVRTHSDRFADRLGVRPEEGAALLTREGAHVEVAVTALTVRHR